MRYSALPILVVAVVGLWSASALAAGGLVPPEVHDERPLSFEETRALFNSRLGLDPAAWPAPIRDRVLMYGMEQIRVALDAQRENIIAGHQLDAAQTDALRRAFDEDPGFTYYLMLDAPFFRFVPARLSPWFLDEVWLPRVLLAPDDYASYLESLAQRMEAAGAPDALWHFVHTMPQYLSDPYQASLRFLTLRRSLFDRVAGGIEQRLAARPPGPYLFDGHSIRYGTLEGEWSAYRFDEGLDETRQVNGPLGRGRTATGFDFAALHVELHDATKVYLDELIPQATVVTEQGRILLAAAREGDVGPDYYSRTVHFIIVDRAVARGAYAVRTPSTKLSASGMQAIPGWVVADFTQHFLGVVMEAVAEAHGSEGFVAMPFDIPEESTRIRSPWYESRNIVVGGDRVDGLRPRFDELQARFDLIAVQLGANDLNLAQRNIATLRDSLAGVGTVVASERRAGRRIEVQLRGSPSDAVMTRIRELEVERAANLNRFVWLQDQIARLTDDLYSSEIGYMRHVLYGMIQSYNNWTSLPDWHDIPSTFKGWYEDSREHAGQILSAQETVLRLRALGTELETLRRQTLNHHQAVLDELEALEPIRAVDAELRALLSGTGWAAWTR